MDNVSTAFMPIVFLVLCRLFPSFEEDAERAGLKLGPQLVELQYNGRTLPTPEERMPRTISTSRIG